MNKDYSLGYVRGFADTHGPLHLTGKRHLNRRAITFKSMDETVLDELALHIDVLGYEYKRYVLAPGDESERSILCEFISKLRFAGFRRCRDSTGRQGRARNHILS